MVTIYLAGAIRDDHPEDIEWREELITRLDEETDFSTYSSVRIINPLGNKSYDAKTKVWSVATIPTNPKGIFRQDLWSVSRADIVVANLIALGEGYPNIGTLMEVGAAASLNKLTYSIIPAGVEGHQNAMFKLHPFLQEASTEIFPSVKECGDFLVSHLGMLTGAEPNFKGVVNGRA